MSLTRAGVDDNVAWSTERMLNEVYHRRLPQWPIRHRAYALSASLPLVILMILAQSKGIYPIDDDFLYFRAAKLWSETGVWTRTRLHQLPTVPNAVPTWLASVMTPHLDSVFSAGLWVNATLWMIAITMLVRGFSAGFEDASYAWLFGFSVAVNFYVIYSSMTFMTDGPAAALSIIGVVLLIQFPHNAFGLFVAGIFLGLALMTRQTAVFACLAGCCILLSERRENWLRDSFLFGLAPVLGLLFCCYWQITEPKTYPGLSPHGMAPIFYRVGQGGYEAFLWIGLLLLPMAPGMIIWKSSRFWLVFAALSCLAGGRFAWSSGQATLLQTNVQNAHFGPILLADAYDPGRWGLLGEVQWPLAVWQVLTAACTISVACWFGWLASSWSVRGGKKNWQQSLAQGFAVLVLLAAILFFCTVMENRFDRYWLALLPVIVVIQKLFAANVVSTSYQKRSVAIGWWIALLLYCLAFAFAHDMLAWNEARWRAHKTLCAVGVDPTEIDGGYSLNGWFRSGEDPDTRPLPEDSENQRWWSGRAKFAISGSLRTGWTVISELHFYSLATMSKQKHFILHRTID